ncbi:MAG TPA: fused MFS/spermidine synthase [Burkholderiales bacterium]|nr:fused MFS/spermidine synthase [Burkholderiales bacterium]
MNRDVKLLFALFTVSGFTGLIYESVWSHYLRLFLGAAAFSQSFVLAAFMGGMALGAWLASRWSTRVANLLGAYGWIEAAIGVAALVFHEVFVLLTQVSLDRVIPALGSPGTVEVYKYSLCALLIVPQTVLLGMTFPLLSGAVIRRGPQESGHHLAMLYFTNSIGAAIGALASAFVLIGWMGMPGTMRLAGALNLALAAAVLAIARRGEPPAIAPAPPGGSPLAGSYIFRLFLAGAFVTGLASFVYEIVWIRMLSLVLGSSFHAFELMLSAFITGLALGGLWIRRRIDRVADPVRFAGVVQVLMGLTALSTVFVYHWTFDWMAWALGVLQKTDSAYGLFNLFSHALAFAVMLPTTFFAGMTLPLFTHVLLRGGRGERAIGQVYAANTLGSIAGVLVAVHLLLPEAGLKLALVVGASTDMLLGAWILRYTQERLRRAHAFAALIAGLLVAALTARIDILEPERLSSGVYRYGRATPDFGRVVFYRDGKTASVAARSQPGGIVAIVTNGKPDAAIRLDTDLPPTPDEYTMSLVAALPLLAKPDAKTFANIGWGSGLTTEVALSHSGPREIDSIEIEPAMYTAAMAFAPRVLRPYHDRRGQVFFEDAKSYFARYGKRYDVIMAEPSNPWVNGVASLFSTEFYRDTKRYLAPGGLFVQWLQVYEFNDQLLASIVGALRENFSDYEIYESNPGDLLVLAVAEGRVPRLGPLPVREKGFMEQLDRLGIKRIEQISARSLGTMRQLEPLFAALAAPVNSDFRPFVQLEAARARFEGSRAQGLMSLAVAPLPILEMLGDTPKAHLSAPVPESDPALRMRRQSAAVEIARLLSDRAADPLQSPEKLAAEIALVLRYPGALCGEAPSKTALEQLQIAAEVTLSSLDPAPLRALWIEHRWLGCAPRSQHVRDRLDVYAAVAAHDARAMLAHARALLAGPATGGDNWGRFLLNTAMLGAHAAGEHAEAQELWRRYSRAFYPGGDIPPYAVYLAEFSTDLK